MGTWTASSDRLHVANFSGRDGRKLSPQALGTNCTSSRFSQGGPGKEPAMRASVSPITWLETQLAFYSEPQRLFRTWSSRNVRDPAIFYL